MINIELEVNTKLNNINPAVDKEINDFKHKLEMVVNYMGDKSFQDDKISLNYYNQSIYVAKAFTNQMEKAEDEIFKKWGLEGRIDVGYQDNEKLSVTSVIVDNLVKQYAKANNMSEINNDNILNNCKDKIVDFFYTELDKYAENYNLGSKLLQNIKNDVTFTVNRHFDKIANKLFNDNIRDELDNLCNELEKSYNKRDFTKMAQITKEISKYFSKNGTIYRDRELFDRLSIGMAKSKMVQNKLENGKEGTLNEMEEELIVKFNKEQIKKIEQDYKVGEVFSKSDVSMARFTVETDMIKEIFENLKAENI